MSSRINLRRDDVGGSDVPTLTRGELFVHLADLQLVVGLEDEFSKKELLPIRIFDVGSRYELGDIVVYDETLYKCINPLGVDPVATQIARGGKPSDPPGENRIRARILANIRAIARGLPAPYSKQEVSPTGIFDPNDWKPIDAEALYDLHVVTLFDPDRTYYLNDVIHYEGSVYAALKDNPGPPDTNPEDWKNIGASAVEDIIQEFNDRLDNEVAIVNWYDTEDYVIGDVVYYQEDIYVCTTDAPAGPWDQSLWRYIHHARMFTGVQKPAVPAEGLMWWDPKSGEMFTWYNDGTSSQWVSTTFGVPGSLTPFDFPDSPSDQDEYSPVVGLRYIWFEDIGAWRADPELYIKSTGGVMTGPLILRPEAPQSSYEATHKEYVDNLFKSFFSVHDNPPTPADGNNGEFWFVRE